VLRCLKGQRAISDGEIVVLDEKGRSNFFELMTAVASLVITRSIWCGSTDRACAASHFWSARSGYADWFHIR